MSEKLSINDIYYIVQNEGLDYTIQSYLSSNDIKDPILKKLFKNAKKALSEFELYVNENFEDSEENNEDEDLA